jgi:hypothetical protein
MGLENREDSLAGVGGYFSRIQAGPFRGRRWLPFLLRPPVR